MPVSISSSIIAAQAFTELELRPLSSYGDDSPEAVEVAAKYGPALDMVLEDYDWSFRRALVALPLLADTSGIEADADLPYIYQLPAQMRALRAIFPSDLRWRRDGTLIRASETGAKALITRQVDKESDLPAKLRHAIALQLALLMAPRYAPTRAKREDLGTALAYALQDARRADIVTASEQRMDELHPATGDDWVTRVTR